MRPNFFINFLSFSTKFKKFDHRFQQSPILFPVYIVTGVKIKRDQFGRLQINNTENAEENFFRYSQSPKNL